ncbi:hypothetical protein [Salicibibacter cibi]|nr:hypothetical protein [Salicibibacter cibi]
MLEIGLFLAIAASMPGLLILAVLITAGHYRKKKNRNGKKK